MRQQQAGRGDCREPDPGRITDDATTRGACRTGRRFLCAGRAGAGRHDPHRLYRPPLGRLRQRGRQRAEALHLRRREDQRGGRLGRQEPRDRGLRQQDRPEGEPGPVPEGGRPGHPLHPAGQRLVGGLGADRRGRQAQQAQPGRGDPVSQLRRGGSGLHQRPLQLLALPLRRRRRHEDGGADRLAGRAGRHQEGLHHRAGLQLRQGGGRRSRADAGARSGPTSRSSATSCTRWARSRTSRLTCRRSCRRAPTR